MFQLIWNAVPASLECEYHIAETRREVKKLCVRAYFWDCKYLSLSMFFDFPWRVRV
nr:thioesterase [Prevotella sp. oral taxon 472]